MLRPGHEKFAGNAVLYVTSGIKFSGSDTITIRPGASLQLYNGGADAGFNPSGGPRSAVVVPLRARA